MMRSMFSGVSSLRVHQTRMDVIANNIANVNTTGFKSQRALFTDAFYQNLQGATGPTRNPLSPGMNAQQIGLGLNMGTIDNIMTQGASQRTDNPFDVSISGAGFFIVQMGDGGRGFTRAGNINMDSQFNLHINGMSLMGWGTRVDASGRHVVDGSRLEPMTLGGEKQTMPGTSTEFIDMVGNLHPSMADDPDAERPVITRTMSIFDSLGNVYTVDVRFTFWPEHSQANDSAFSYWTFEFENDDDGVVAFRNGVRETANRAVLGIDAVTGGNGGGDGPFGALAFNTDGTLVGVRSWAAPDPVTDPLFTDADLFEADPTGDWTILTTGTRYWDMSIVPISGVAPSASFGSGVEIDLDEDDPISSGTIRIDSSRLTAGMDAASHRFRIDTVDGGPMGTLRDISIGADGTIIGSYTNGAMRILGQIPLAVFDNPAGLERAGANVWLESANSGSFDGLGEVGAMQGGALEMSNVDLASEFTEMITTQRGFQAASRTITVSDEMIQELVNLRR